MLRVYKAKKYEFGIDLLFWIGLFLVLCSDLFEEMCFQNIMSGGLVRKIGIICLAIKAILDIRFFSLDYKDKLVQIFSLASGVTTFFITRDISFLVIILVIISSNGIRYYNIQKMYVFMLCLVFTINIILVLIGLKTNSTVLASPGHIMYNRNDLGFVHPNRPMSEYLNILICLIIIYKEKLSSSFFVIFLIGAGILFYYTDSRGAMLAIMVVVFFMFLRNTDLKELINKYQISKILFVYSVLIMIVLGCVFNGERMVSGNLINTFVSRVMAWGKAFESLGFTFFGSGKELSFPMDCVFYRIIFKFGFFGAITYVLLFCKSFVNNENNYYFNIAMIGLCIISVFESRIVYIQYILPLISAFADNNMLKDEIIIETSKPDKLSLVNLEKCINYMICFGVGGLLIGHAFIQHHMESIELARGEYVGISPRFTDIIFMLISSVVGIFIYNRKCNNV